ncbi:MAG: transcription elongation factor GreA [Armatimonadota bacterium]
MEELPRGKYYVTVQGAEKLETELRELESKRTEVAGNIRTAKAYGDLSENFEYHEAKREQGFVEGRIIELKQIVPEMHVVRPEEVSTDKIGFGSVVTVREETGDEWEFQVVGPLEADPMADRISYESPLGRAMIGRKVGETVEAEVPAGTVRYEIVSIDTYTA